MTPDVSIDGIPRALRDVDSWICWREAERNGRVTKIPMRPDGSGKAAKSNDPDTWGTFIEAVEKARKKPEYGVGFVFSEMDPFVGVDLDSAIDADGNLKTWVPAMKDEEGLPWLEYSPSGTGVHIIAYGGRPEWWTNLELERDDDAHEGVEVYDSGRFFTVTGDVPDAVADDLRESWDVEGWLRAAHEAIEGEEPGRDESPTEGPERSQGESGGSQGGRDGGGESNADVPDVDVRDVVGRAYEPGTRFAHPVHGSSTGSNFMVDNGGETWRCWRHDCTGNALQLLGVQIGAVDCGEWTSRTIDSETWREILDGARERELIPEETSPDYVPTPAELIARYSDEYETADDVPRSALEAFDDAGDSEPIESVESREERESGLSSAVTWDDVYAMYQGADKHEEKRVARFNALRRLREAEAWANVRESDTLYHYDPGSGIYTPHGDSVLRELLVGGLREHFAARELQELKQSLRGLTTIGAGDLGGPTRKLAVANGVLDLDTGELEPHSHEHRFLAALDTEFQPDAVAPTWLEFLEDVVPRESERLKLQEYAGYTLAHSELPHHKALFLVGPTASGKSTFLDTVRAVLGRESVSSLTPQEITAEKYGGAELFGKLANIRNDIPSQTLDNVGMFKEVTSGDSIKAERKYQDPFYFPNTAKFLFSANQLPDAKVDDEAFFRRILLVPFPVTIPVEARDLDLDDKIQQELPGVLNWALEGLERLQLQGGFTGDRDPGMTEETWRRWGNPVKRFTDECLEDTVGSGAALSTSEVYQVFARYCAEENIPSVSHHKMTQKLKQDGKEYGRARIDGSRTRAILGVKWTDRGIAIRDRQRSGAGGENDPTRRGLGAFEDVDDDVGDV